MNEFGDDGNAVAAILLLQAATMTMDVYSALNSSPWTSENFGADPDKANSCREYVAHAMIFSLIYCAAASGIAHSPYPLVGGIVNNGYMYWLYERALQRGAVAGSDSWAKDAT